MADVVLITGGNISDKTKMLASACESISERVGEVVMTSKVYESDPWGFDSAEAFLNQVLVCRTSLSPIEVLDTIQSIEESLGRVRNPITNSNGERVYYSRIIDIDILFYDDLVFDSVRLTIPHPLICSRDFVLTPLKEILGDFVHPVIGKRISEL